MVEGGVEPRGRTMTLRAVRGKAPRQVIRVGSGLEIGLVTIHAGCRRSRESPTHVARGTRQRGMGAGKREMRERRVIELRAQPGIHGMTQRTIQREGAGLMWWVLSRYKVVAVAGSAFRAQAHEDAVGRPLVATLALHPGVRSQQRKAVGMFARRNARRRRPAAHRVTLLAVVSHLRPMQIRVAGPALVPGLLEYRVQVASLARHPHVHSA